jgi:hypothetical protein
VIPDRLWQLYGRYLFWRLYSPRGQAWHYGWKTGWMQARVTALIALLTAIIVFITLHFVT